MTGQSLFELKKQFTDQYVQADISRPELARFRGMVGRVVTVNENGLALVDFSDGPWYDLPLEALTVVPKPEKKPAAGHEKPEKGAPKAAAGEKPAPKAAAGGEKKVAPKAKPTAKPSADAE
ncbi:MAG: hypothetical protein U1D30_26200 [Planctomycetota bacterium]